MSTTIKPGAHHVLGGSSVDRWLNCAPSVQLQYKLGVGSGGAGTSPYAFEGTVAHYVAERCLRDGREVWEFIGETYVAEEDPELEVTVTSEMTAAVQEFVSYCYGMVNQYLDAGYAVDWNVEASCEGGYVKIGKTKITAGGTVDFGIRARGEDCTIVHVIDYKHGAGIWVPADASQLLAYAVWFAQPSEDGSNSEMIYRTTVVQPRADNPGAGTETIREAEFSGDYMVDFAKRLDEGKKQIKDPLAPFTPGPWCKYCPVKTSCPVIFGPAARATEEGEPRDLPNEALSEWLMVKDQLARFAKDVEQVAYQKMAQGENVPGYKLVDRFGNRAWVDGAFEALADVVDVGQLYEQKPRTPAQVEKFGKEVKDVVSRYSYQPHRGLTVAPADDKREGVTPRTGADAFADVASN